MKSVYRILVFLSFIVQTADLFSQCIVINEILVNPNSPNDGANSPNTAEWIEFANTCETAVDVSCWVFTDGDFSVTFPAGTIIPANSYFTIGSPNSGVSLDLNWATCGCTAENGMNEVGIFSNNSEQIALIDDTGNFLDGIYWGSGQFPVNINSDNLAGCSDQTINYNSSALFTQLPAPPTEACTYSMLCDGSWSETCGGFITPGAANDNLNIITDIEVSDNTTCTGECLDFTFTGAGGSSWIWTFEGATTGSSNLQNPGSICYDVPGFYDVTITVSNSCTSVSQTYADFIEVIQTPAPYIDTFDPLDFCAGGNASLLSSDVGNYQWYQDGVAIPGATLSEYFATASGSYTVEVSAGNCSAFSEAVIVNVLTIEAIPTDPSGEIVICAGQETTLSSLEAFDTYQWLLDESPVPGASAASYTTSIPGNYSLEVSLGGCYDTSDVIVISEGEINPPVIAYEGIAEICDGNILEFLVEGNYDSYQWFLNGNPIAGAINPLLNTDSAGIYTVQITLGACTGISDDVTLIVHPVAEVSIAPEEDVVSCASAYLLQAVSTGDIQWQLNGTDLPGETSNTLLITEDGVYSFVSELNNLCPVSSDLITVSLNNTIDVSILASADSACTGDTISLKTNLLFEQINWSTGQNAEEIFVTTTNDYRVNVLQGDCIASDTLHVKFNETPEVIAMDDFQSPCTDFIELTGSSTAPSRWEVNAFPVALGDSARVENPVQNTEFVFIGEMNGCTADDTVLVTVDCITLFIPNCITPDGDGINDVFRVEAYGITHYNLKIFDRWGALVFESDNPEDVWTGGYPDYFVPDGVYVFQVEALDALNRPLFGESKRRGTITVLR